MKKIRNYLILAAIVSVVVAAIMFYVFSYQNGIFLLALPFELLGKGLRWLSLYSAVGNIVAIIFYVIISALPLSILFHNISKGINRKADYMLLLITLYHFFFLYSMVNPGLIAAKFYSGKLDNEMLLTLAATLTIFYLSLWAGYIFLRLTESVFTPGAYHKSLPLNRLLKKLLLTGAYLYIILFFYNYSVKMFRTIGIASGEQSFSTSLSYPIMDYVLTGIPVIYTVLILIYGARLLEVMETDHLKEEENIAAIRLGEAGRYCIYATVICNIASNTLQLILAKQLHNINMSVNISFLPLIVAFFSMILSTYFKEAEKLKNNDELFI